MQRLSDDDGFRHHLGSRGRRRILGEHGSQGQTEQAREGKRSKQARRNVRGFHYLRICADSQYSLTFGHQVLQQWTFAPPSP